VNDGKLLIAGIMNWALMRPDARVGADTPELIPPKLGERNGETIVEGNPPKPGAIKGA
jgi:hypothetical protein